MLQRIVNRQVCAKACSRYDCEIVRITMTNERQQLVSDIMLPGVMTLRSMVRMNAFIIPAVSAFTVGTINLDKSLINFVCQRVDHLKVFPFCKGGERCRKDDHGRAPVTKAQ